MAFPIAENFIYKNNPLDQVICQLRFPTILKIESEAPVAFQEEIKKNFPVLNENMDFQIDLGRLSLSSVSPEVLNKMIQPSTSKNYEFLSEDQVHKVNLTKNFIAFTCSKYIDWSTFIDIFINVLSTFMNIYNPSYFSRVGLRYIDVIDRSVLSLETTPWNHLLNSQLLGLVGVEGLEDKINSFENVYEIKIDDEIISRISTKFVTQKEAGDLCYLIDSDFFTLEKTSVNDIKSKLAIMNDHAYRFWKWCITQTLHNHLEAVKK